MSYFRLRPPFRIFTTKVASLGRTRFNRRVSLFPKAQSHHSKFFKESKEVSGALEKLSAIAVAFGFADATGQTLTLAAAGVVASKAWDAIATGVLFFAKAPKPSATDLLERHQTLILLIVHEAYAKALAHVIESQPDSIRIALMPHGGTCTVENFAAQEKAFELIKGRSLIFKAYEERLRRITTSDGQPVDGRDRLASEVSLAATQILSALLMQPDEPYGSLRNYLQNEAIGTLGELLQSGNKTSSEAAPRPTIAVPFLSPFPPSVSVDAKSSISPETLTGLSTEASPRPAKLEITGAGEVSEQLRINKTMFDKAKALLEKGKISQAQTLYETVAQDLTNSAAPDAVFLRARAIGNVGHCLHRLGMNKEAAPYFREGYQLAPTHLRMRVNLALAELTDENFGAAETLLRAVLAEKPDETDVVELLADTLSRRGDHASAVAELQAHPRESENYFCMLSVIHERMGHYDQAFTAAKAGITKHPVADYLEFCAAMALITPILNAEDDTTRRFESGAAAKLTEAAGHLERAVALARQDENKAMLRLYLSNLCAVYGAVRRRDAALKAGEEARALGDKSHQLFVNLFAAQVDRHHVDDAIATARALRATEPLTVALRREMHAGVLGDRFPLVIAAYDEAAASSSEVASDPQLLSIRIHAQRYLPDLPGARAALTEAFTRFGRDPHLVLQAAHLAEVEGKQAEAEACFLESEGHGTPRDRHIGRIECGMYYYRRKQFAKAFDRLVSPREDPLLCTCLTEYLICLHQLKRFPELAETGLRAIRERPFKEMIWSLTGHALAQLGRLAESEQIQRDLVQHHPTEQHHLELAGIHYRRNDTRQAITVLESARAKFPKSFYVIANLSGIYFATRQYRKAFDAATDAHKLAPHRAEAHVGLLRFLTIGNRLTLSNSEKELIQAVLLKADNIQRFYIKQLRGGGVDFTEMIDALKEPQKERERIRAEYHKKHLPVSILARAIGRDLTDTWFGVSQAEGERVFSAAGTLEEQEAEGKLALESNAVVVDGTSLFTLNRLGLLSVLAKLYKQIYIPNALRERLVDDLRHAEAMIASAGTVSLENDRLRFNETGEAFHEEKLAALRAVVAFVTGPEVIIEGLDQEAWKEWQQLRTVDIFADWMMTPMLLARSKQCALLSDEHAMRVIAAGKYGVAGFWTQALIRAAATRRLITHADHNRMTLQLVALNYDYVSVTDEMAEEAIANAGYTRDRTIRNIFRLLESSGYEGKNATELLGATVARAWFYTTPTSSPSRREWLDACLTSLSVTKNRTSALISLVASMVIPLMDFPEAFTALTLALEEHPSLNAEERQVIRILRRKIPPVMIKVAPVVWNRRMHVAWSRMAQWVETKDRVFKRRS